MSNDKFVRLLRLQTKVNTLILEGKRNIDPILDHLQGVLDTAESKPVDEGPLLAYESTWSTHWLRESFVADEHLKVNRSSNAMIPIKRLGDNIKLWFAGKVEDPRNEGKLWKTRLQRWAHDKEVFNNLGEEKVETTLWEMLCFLSNVHTKGDWYIFYIRDTQGILRAVDAIWNTEVTSGWLIDANEINLPAGNNPKMCIVFRYQS